MVPLAWMTLARLKRTNVSLSVCAPVGIDDECDRLPAHTRNGRPDLGAHLRNGGVHEQDAVVTDEEDRVAALPVQEVDTVAEVCRLDLELRVVFPPGRIAT